MYQGTYPQLHLTEDARESPHVLTLQIAAVAPSVDLDRQFVATFSQILCNVELSRRHRVLAVTHLLTVDPDIHRRMNAPEVQDEVLSDHLVSDIDEGHIRAYGIAVVVGIPVLRGFTRHAGAVAVEGVLHVHIDGFAKALQLPVARYGNLVPLTHIIVLALKAHGSAFRVFRPMEQPLAVE